MNRAILNAPEMKKSLSYQTTQSFSEHKGINPGKTLKLGTDVNSF
jgi:hypothetical protein